MKSIRMRSEVQRASLEARLNDAVSRCVSVRSSDGLDTRGAVSENRLHQTLMQLAPYPVTERNRTKVLTDGEATYASILKALESANHHIHLDYYTIRNDGIGDKFLKVLAEKAKRGVQVRVLYDGIGSMKLDQTFLDTLSKAGAEYGCFSPLKASLARGRINYRNHRKMIVVDGEVGFLGGINIGDEYIGLDRKLGYWRDTHLRVQGDAVYYLQALFMCDWLTVTGKQLPDDPNFMPDHSIRDVERVLIVPGRPGINDQKIIQVLITAMASAQAKIYAVTPYFIPDPSLAMSLRIAARSGIDVKLIIPGIADSKLVLLATLSYVQDMLEAGVRVYRYQKGFIHSKVLIIDDTLASVGTANLDMRSLYSNYELLALLFDEKRIRKLENDFMEDMRHSEEIDPLKFARRPRKQKTAEAVMHILSPLL